METILARRRWDEPRDGQVEFAVYSHGQAERMPAGQVVQRSALDDWLWVCFHDAVQAEIGEQELEVPAFGIVVWRPSELRKYGRTDREWTHTWLQLSGTRVEGILQSVGMLQERSWKDADPAGVERLWRELHDEAVRQTPDTRILGNVFETGLLRLRRYRREAPVAVETRLDELRAWLDVRTERRVGLEEMARRAGMSRSHFSALFQERFGTSPGDYHLQRRMEAARFLLMHRGLRVDEAGAAVGYPDPASFSRMFRRVVGCSPRKDREKAGQVPKP